MANKKLEKCVPGLEWEKEDIKNIDGSIGEKYYYKGMLAIKIPLQGNFVTQLAGYTLIQKDILIIIEWIQKVIEEYKIMGIDKSDLSSTQRTPDNLRNKIDIIKAFMVAAITFYGKLFTKADGRKIKLESNIYESKLGLLKIHNEIMMYRHNFTAHSGYERVEYVEVSLFLDSNKERNTIPFLVRTMNQPAAFSNKFLDNFVNVCIYLLTKVNDKINNLNKKYYEDLTPKQIEMMYEIAKR